MVPFYNKLQRSLVELAREVQALEWQEIKVEAKEKTSVRATQLLDFPTEMSMKVALRFAGVEEEEVLESDLALS